MATFAMVIYVIDLINQRMPDTVPEMYGLLQVLSGFNQLEWIVVGFILLCVMIYGLGNLEYYKTNNEKSISL